MNCLLIFSEGTEIRIEAIPSGNFSLRISTPTPCFPIQWTVPSRLYSDLAIVVTLLKTPPSVSESRDRTLRLHRDRLDDAMRSRILLPQRNAVVYLQSFNLLSALHNIYIKHITKKAKQINPLTFVSGHIYFCWSKLHEILISHPFR